MARQRCLLCVLWVWSTIVNALSLDQCLGCSASSSGTDTIDHITVWYPKAGDMATLPLRFKFDFMMSSEAMADVFKTQYRDKFVCVEVESQLERVAAECSPIMGATVFFEDLRLSSYVARAFISDGGGTVRCHETEEVPFTIVNTTDLDAHRGRLIEQVRVEQKFPQDLNILQWAEQHKKEHNSNDGVGAGPTGWAQAAGGTDGSEILLANGVKTALLMNFARRQAIRETWANKTTLPSNVKVFFLGCSPILKDISSSRDRERFEAAVELERAVYGDLLTEELNCQDARAFLADKVSGFLEWLGVFLPQTTFVLIADDDIYARIDKIAADVRSLVLHKGVYVGESLEQLHTSALRPIRDPKSVYYTSKENYPLEQFPPYAAGPHFLLSMDCARFIAQNRRRLGTLSGQDDTTIGLWLLAIQVHVQFTPLFASLRSHPCRNIFLSLADLSPIGIRSIHSNVLQGRQFCHGFDRMVWVAAPWLS